jgi:uncharacterized protein
VKNPVRIELRSDSVILDGYVNVTQRLSRVLPSPRGPFVEEIMPRTFERALMKSSSVDLLFNHNRNRKLGSTNEGNLELREDNVGLRAIATVTDKEVIEKARKGELRGWSFGFSVIKDTWKTHDDGMQKRSVEEIDLFEISVLDKTPAYVATSLEARGQDDFVLNETRSEDFQAKVDDYSEQDTDKTDNNEETKDDQEQEENRESKVPESYFDNLEKETAFMQLKGGINK